MLEKHCKLYRAQFEEFLFTLYGDHRVERYTLDLDGILFIVKYMIRKNIDLDTLPQLDYQFTQTAVELRKCFGEFMYSFLCSVIGIPEPFKLEDITDVLARDVKMDPTYVDFDILIISENRAYLEYVENSWQDDKPYNMNPEKYFRFSTSSYNDGIARAYPELFEVKHKEGIGKGDDGNIFVHNLTFQVLEHCSLNCVSGSTEIFMIDGSSKPIRDIKVNDQILGFDELDGHLCQGAVTHVFQRQMDTSDSLYKITYKDKELLITGNHNMYVSTTTGVQWVPVGELTKNDWLIDSMGNIIHDYKIEPMVDMITVYNLETTCNTYIANGLKVHNCSYCYQFAKRPSRMTLDIAKEFIDNLLSDTYGYINKYNSPAIILEFIGGEPLLEITQIRRIYEYFLDKCYELNHPWFTLHRISLCSNGMQYFDKEVQDFFRDYGSQISFNISIDGNKELHDACRIQPNGEGSYDVDMMALSHFNKYYSKERNSKMTLAPSNISYLFDSVVDFINHGTTVININCVFEEGWNRDTALIEYEQLKKLADYLLDNDLEHLYIAIFTERQEDVMSKFSDGTFCGGNGAMLSIRPNGQFYPCIRYMPTSVGDSVPDLSLGSVQDGMIGREQDSPVLNMLDKITRRSQNNDICWECPLSNSCASCLALGHAVYGTPNKRTTFICAQVIAEALANIYYWNLLEIKHPEYHLRPRINNVPDEWALLIIDQNELDFLKEIESLSLITYMENE